jgi:hypothetical protein
MTRSPLIVGLGIALLASAALAQLPNATNTTATPAPGDHDYLGSLIETVNPANGSVSVRVATRMPQGRQLTLPFSFAYDSNGAFYFGQRPDSAPPTYATILPVIGSQGGWSYSYPVMSFSGSSWKLPGTSEPPITCWGSTNYVFQDENGNRHNLGLSVSADYSDVDGLDENCNAGILGDGEFATGGEGPILATTTLPTNPKSAAFPSVTVTDGNGTIYAFPGGGLTLPFYSVTSLAANVTDRNGNAVTITGKSGGAVTYSDTLGRTVLSTSGMGGNPDTITVGGLGAAYKAYWGPASASFPNAVIDYFPGTSKPCPTSWSASSKVVSEIDLPNKKKFTFTYDSTYGMMTQIGYPSGGYVRYVWGLNKYAEAGAWQFHSSGGDYIWACRYGFPAITDRYVSYDGNPSHEVLHQHFDYSTDWPNDSSATWTTKTTTVTTTDLLRKDNQGNIVHLR